MRRILTMIIYGLSGLIGLLAFTYPFLIPSMGWVGESFSIVSPNAHQGDAPILTLVLVVLCLGVLLIEVHGQAVSAKVVAALGMLVAATAVLRFVEVVIPGPGGFSLIFAPIILSGYVFGPRFGFLLGTMSMLVSALVTGNVGPWLPYQMFTAGWVGLTSGWLPHPTKSGFQLILLVLFSFLWGLLFGAIMNLYFWPFVTDGTATSWQPGVGFISGLSRYLSFYLATSLIWDIGRALGNAILILALGVPTLRALIRFRDRFEFQVA